MIKMVKGTYGYRVNGSVEAMTKRSGPFSLSEARENELVEAGVAVKVENIKEKKETAKKNVPKGK